MGTMKASRLVRCVAMSKDGNWIAAGSDNGWLSMWDAKTYEQVLNHKEGSDHTYGVDFSPDSARLVATADSGVIVWNLPTCKQVQILHHGTFWDPARALRQPLGNPFESGTAATVTHSWMSTSVSKSSWQLVQRLATGLDCN